jgi:hypothetical protein
MLHGHVTLVLWAILGCLPTTACTNLVWFDLDGQHNKIWNVTQTAQFALSDLEAPPTTRRPIEWRKLDSLNARLRSLKILTGDHQTC